MYIRSSEVRTAMAIKVFFSIAAIVVLSSPATIIAQQNAPAPAAAPPPAAAPTPAAAPAPAAPARGTTAKVAGAAATAPVVPPDYVVGPDDVLQLVFWREKDMSAEVTVRPDGMISVPLVNEVNATGLTPDQLRERIMTE